MDGSDELVPLTAARYALTMKKQNAGPVPAFSFFGSDDRLVTAGVCSSG